MKKHRWIAIGSAQMDQPQAAAWSTVEGAIDAPLEMLVSSVICVVCDSAAEEAPPSCPGQPPVTAAFPTAFPHRWMTTLTASVEDDQQETWVAAGDLAALPLPRSTNVVCVLCGSPIQQSDADCPERKFWVVEDGATDVPDFEPDDFISSPSTTPSAPKRRSHLGRGIQAIVYRHGRSEGDGPAYEVRFERLGDVFWRGEAHVERLGEHEGHVPIQDLARFGDLLELVGFWDWDHRDLDGQLTEPTVNQRGGASEIVVETETGVRSVIQRAYDDPPEFWVLESAIYYLIGEVYWLRGEPS